MMLISPVQYEPGILINIYNLPKNFTGYQAREYLPFLRQTLIAADL